MTGELPSVSRTEVRQISPAPFWLATHFPFPVGVHPLRDDNCTPAHRNAVAAARHVRSVLYAMVAIGQLDVTRFLRIACLNGAPAKYMSYLRGQSVLHDVGRRQLEQGIIEMATYISMDSSPERMSNDPPGFQPWKHYSRLSEVTEDLHAPLLDPRWLCVDEGHIITAIPWPRTGSSYIRTQWAVHWAREVNQKARSMGLLRACRCHALQALYEEGSIGPPNEWIIFARGGPQGLRLTQ